MRTGFWRQREFAVMANNLDTYEQANRAWFGRMQSEAALWMELASASMSMTFTSNDDHSPPCIRPLLCKSATANKQQQG
jgi:hypothetical protein